MVQVVWGSDSGFCCTTSTRNSFEKTLSTRSMRSTRTWNWIGLGQLDVFHGFLNETSRTNKMSTTTLTDF